MIKHTIAPLIKPREDLSMKTKLLIGLLAAPLMFGLAMPSYAKKKAEPVTCEDGSTSTAHGRGACSGHGGVKKDAAAPSGGGSTCKDGSTSDKTGRGACSGHGGVAKTASAATAPAAAAPAAAPAPAPAPAPAATPAPVAAAPAASKAAPTAAASATDPQGATAKCKDGTFSHSTGHKGACSHHGGVGEWLTAAK